MFILSFDFFSLVCCCLLIIDCLEGCPLFCNSRRLGRESRTLHHISNVLTKLSIYLGILIEVLLLALHGLGLDLYLSCLLLPFNLANLLLHQFHLVKFCHFLDSVFGFASGNRQI